MIKGEGKMKIICQNCNKGRGCKKTDASTYNKMYEGFTRIFIQIRCNKCNYVATDWEAPEEYEYNKDMEFKAVQE